MRIQPTSNRQQAYLQMRKRKNRKIKLTQFFICIGFLLLWELSSDFGWIDSFFFSSPKRILSFYVHSLSEGTLLSHIGMTFLETACSFLLVTMISIAVATLLWFQKSLSKVLEPYLVILNSLPKSALAPLLLVWLGSGIDTIIIAGISVAVFGSIISIYNGYLQTEPEKEILIQTLGGTRMQTFQLVVFPQTIPILLSITKVNIGLSLVGVIIGEFLSARKGLGYLIIYGSQTFQLTQVIASILLLCFMAYIFYHCITLFENKAIKKPTGH